MISGGAIAALVLAIWAMQPSSPAPTASAPAAQSSGAGQGARTNPAPVAPVKLDALSAERQQPSDTPRNPFRYQPKAVPTPPPTVAPPTDVIEAPKPVAPPGPPPVAPIQLKFIGILERANGVKWAVLSDGKVTMHGRDGDIVDGRYRIVKIGTESIEMSYVDGRGRQVIRLTGQ
jgi:hypothetical protein